MLPMILKLLTPTLLKQIVKYVTEPNELDEEVININKRLDYKCFRKLKVINFVNY